MAELSRATARHPSREPSPPEPDPGRLGYATNEASSNTADVRNNAGEDRVAIWAEDELAGFVTCARGPRLIGENAEVLDRAPEQDRPRVGL
jgi:hypothetical protein